VKRNLIVVVSVYFILSLSGCTSLAEDTPSLRVAAVQFEVREEVYADENDFREAVEGLIERAVRERKADLIIFPEYTSVFLSLQEYTPVVADSDTFLEGFTKLQLLDNRIESLPDLFFARGEEVEKQMDTLWGGLAEHYGIYIVAGTTFVPDRTEDGKPVLHNRAFVYGPDGGRLYTQDKVFLTDFETGILKLSPGTLNKAERFIVEENEIVLSICRDTFMEEWDDRFSGADLWLDLKANGDVYDQDQVENFRKALPERISHTDIPYGVTVCLTGSYLDLFWEGESSVIRKTGSGYSVEKYAKNWTGEDILYFSLVN